MTCKRCGYQNNADAVFCSGCGRKLHQSSGINKKALAFAGACLLIIGIGIGNLLSGMVPSGEKTGKDNGAGRESLHSAENGKMVNITQVLPMDDGSVAAVYADGTVRVAGNQQFAEAVQDWSGVAQIYYNVQSTWQDGEFHDESILVGLTEKGSVLTTDGSLSGWNNVKELHFTWQSTVGVTNDGTVLIEGDWEDTASQSVLAGMTDVETLVYADIQSTFACLKKDGTVHLVSEFGYTDPYETRWENVREVRDAGHGFYVIKEDGTVDGDLADTYSGLTDAAKLVDYNDWIFGISADGRLLTHNGGNIYTNAGDMMVDAPGLTYYGEEVDIHQFDQVREIVPCCGLILLNEDGSAEYIGAETDWDLSSWNSVEKVCGRYSTEEGPMLYGLREDGSVITHWYGGYQDQYRGWKLQDLYPSANGVVGVTTEGNLVGDGIYEYADFSALDP